MDLEEKVIKLEALAWLIAHVDGLTKDEAASLDFLPGQVRAYSQLREGVMEFEKTGDLDQAMKHVHNAPIFVTQLHFGMPEHIQEVIDEVEAIAESETVIDDFKTLVKIRASEFDDEFDQKLFLGCIEDVVSADGVSDIEMFFFLEVSRLWGVTRQQAIGWFNEYVLPVFEEAMIRFGEDHFSDDELSDEE